jgi:predicted cupin superfamily sugar epimerase
LIRALELEPHPEGGYYREVYRSAAKVLPADGRPTRSAVTTIYFLLPRGVETRWHCVQSDEVWHLYEGGPLELHIAPHPTETPERVVLGRPIETPGPIHTVRAGSWQRARSLGPYTLAGCSVAPGFEFADFTIWDEKATT